MHALRVRLIECCSLILIIFLFLAGQPLCESLFLVLKLHVVYFMEAVSCAFAHNTLRLQNTGKKKGKNPLDWKSLRPGCFVLGLFYCYSLMCSVWTVNLSMAFQFFCFLSLCISRVLGFSASFGNYGQRCLCCVHHRLLQARRSIARFIC